MIRWRGIISLSAAVFALLAPGAEAASPLARATLVRCDRDAREAVFDGRITAYRRAPRMQMRFTLQAQTPESRRWRRVDAPGWGEWITAPAYLGKYTYTKTVQDLLAPASYRAVVGFRWRDLRGRTIRSARAISRPCRQPDARPDLTVSDARFALGEYTAVIVNRGRRAAGPFSVDFVVDGSPLGRVDVVGLEPQTPVTVMLSGPACAPGTPLEAVADPRAQVDESDEENDSFSTTC